MRQDGKDRREAQVRGSRRVALRLGELAELRRGDVDLEAGLVRVRRGVVRADDEVIVKAPKSDAGRRVVAVSPRVLGILRTHLDAHVGAGSDALMFPARHGGRMATSTLYKTFNPARESIGHPDLRWHDLRHTGLTLAAQVGSTLAELTARAGHSSPQAAMRYQHAAAERDRAIAEKRSALPGAGRQEVAKTCMSIVRRDTMVLPVASRA